MITFQFTYGKVNDQRNQRGDTAIAKSIEPEEKLSLIKTHYNLHKMAFS